ncbi:hypothetical protein DKP78_18200, partial [Enterococcus faecium]
EEDGREDQRRGDAVDEEVEIFRGPADHHADGDVARIDVFRVATHRVGDVPPGGIGALANLAALWCDSGRGHEIFAKTQENRRIRTSKPDAKQL